MAFITGPKCAFSPRCAYDGKCWHRLGCLLCYGERAWRPGGTNSRAFWTCSYTLTCCKPLIFFTLPEATPNLFGLSLAVLSGTVTSGLGYALWYYVLRDITVTTASVSQLSVPVIAAIGGTLFVFEPVTWGFALSCLVILLGVGLATIKFRS